MTPVVSLREFIIHMDVFSDEYHAYLDKRTGELVTISNEEISIVEEDLDPLEYPEWQHPVIEKANLTALQNDFKLDHLFELSRKIAPHIDTLWMGSFNPFYHKGIETFIAQAHKAGVNGFIIPDLPFEEARPYKPSIEEAGLNLIDFIAPTDSKARIEQIVTNAQKFIYLVAYAGITGAGKSEDLQPVIADIKSFTKTPVYVGFGVDQNTAKEKAKGVEGVIVGSAFVKVLLDESLSDSQKITKISAIAKEIKEKIN